MFKIQYLIEGLKRVKVLQTKLTDKPTKKKKQNKRMSVPSVTTSNEVRISPRTIYFGMDIMTINNSIKKLELRNGQTMLDVLTIITIKINKNREEE